MINNLKLIERIKVFKLKSFIEITSLKTVKSIQLNIIYKNLFLTNSCGNNTIILLFQLSYDEKNYTHIKNFLLF